MPTLKDVAELLGVQSERQMASKLGLQPPISTLALIRKYKQLPPKARFSVVPDNGTMPLTVQFTDESLGYIAARDWKFGDGGTSNDLNPSHTYGKPAQEFGGSDFHLLACVPWSPTLTVSNKAGSDTTTGSVTVNPVAPVAKLEAQPTSGPAPLTVSFGVDPSSGYCLYHQWEFGDGTSATTSGQAGPSHLYRNPGTYNVVLKVSNTAGESYTGTTITVTQGSEPPPPTDAPYITAGRDPNFPGIDVSGSKFKPNAAVQVMVTNASDQGLLASVTILADAVGHFDTQFVNVTNCTGSPGFSALVKATDDNGPTYSNTVAVSC